MTIQDKFAHSGYLILQKLKSQPVKKTTISYLPVKQVLKQVQIIYDERVRMIRVYKNKKCHWSNFIYFQKKKEKRLDSNIEMCIFAFNKMIQLFGF